MIIYNIIKTAIKNNINCLRKLNRWNKISRKCIFDSSQNTYPNNTIVIHLDFQSHYLDEIVTLIKWCDIRTDTHKIFDSLSNP